LAANGIKSIERVSRSLRPSVFSASPLLVVRPVSHQCLCWLSGGAIPHGTAFVFASERGGPLHDSNLARRKWHPLLASLEIEKTGFHILRHTFASVVLQAGLDIGTVSRILGHASASITLSIYSHHIPGREKEAAAAIAAVVAGDNRG
jgi:integrase